MALNASRRPHRKREPTIALINVVFLLLVFFLIAGTLAPPLDNRLTLIKTADLEAAPPPDGVVILSDGTLLKSGDIVTIEDIVADGGVVRIVPDRELPAAKLVQIGRQLRSGGIEEVVIITEQALGQ